MKYITIGYRLIGYHIINYIAICHIIIYISLNVTISLLHHYILLDYPDASIVHASGSVQLQANPHVAGPWLSHGKPTRRAVTTMGSSDMVVGEDHMLGPSCRGITGKWAGVAR